jgi:chromate transporter
MFLLVLRSSLLSTGGFGNVPALHTDLVGGGVTTEATFAQALAVGQISPGPNGLWVVSLGYLVSGWWGALAATIAVLLPPLLVLVVERVYYRAQDHPAVEGLIRGLSLAVVGVFLVVMGRLVGTFRHDNLALAAAVLACGLGLSKKVPVLWVILGAAGFGIVVSLGR